MAAPSHIEKVELSKARGKDANERSLPFSHSRGRRDAAWEAIAKGDQPMLSPRSEESQKVALQRANSSGDHLRMELRSELDAQQLKTFKRWWNSWLAEVDLKVDDLCEDVKPGVLPIKLLEILSDSSCGKVPRRARSKKSIPPRARAKPVRSRSLSLARASTLAV